MEEKTNEIDVTKATIEDIAKDKPLSLGGYLDLPITEEQRDTYTFHILKRIDEILEDAERKKEMENAESYRNQYFGIVNETSFPWSGSYNLDTRLTPKIQDAVVAQTEEAFDDVDPRWSVSPTVNVDLLPIREKQEKVLDHFEDAEMNNVEDLEGIRHDSFLLGLGWEAVLFDKKYIRSRELRVYNKIKSFIKDFPNDYTKYPSYFNDLVQGKEVSLIVEENKLFRSSPVRRHIEYEDVICPLTAKGVEGVNNTDCLGRRVWLKWHEIKELEDKGDYIKGVSERLKFKSQLGKNDSLEEDPDYLNKDYETFEVQYWIYIGKHRIKCLFNIAKEYQLCLRSIRYPFNHQRSYLIPHCIQYTRKGLFQDGIGRKLQDIHIAGNATINHILNAATLANSLSLKARENSDAARRIMEHRWFPGSVLELQNMNDAEQFQFGTPNLASLISLFGIIEKFGSDVSGIVNYQLGVESPEDPEAPASKTIALMRKAEIKLRRYIKNLKRSEDEAGYQALMLIYQNIPVKELSNIIGEDMAGTDKLLYTPLRVITNSTGFAIEKIFTKRDDMQMASALMKDPMVMQDPIRRARLWQVLAKSAGSNWDKKIIGIVPTPEEIQAEQQKALQEKQAKKMEVIKQAAQKVLESGGDENMAREAGLKAGQYYEQIDKNQETMMAQQQQEQKR